MSTAETNCYSKQSKTNIVDSCHATATQCLGSPTSHIILHIQQSTAAKTITVNSFTLYKGNTTFIHHSLT